MDGLPAAASKAQAKQQGWQAAGITAICGYVNAYTLMNFGVYASFMAGNTTTAGANLAQRHFALAGHTLLPIPSFLVGVVAATLLENADARRAMRRLPAIGAALILLEVIATLVHAPQWLNIVILSVAMGMINTVVTQVGYQPVSLGFITGDLNSLAKEVAEGVEKGRDEIALGWQTPWRRAGLLATLWGAFLLGSFVGATLVHQTPVLALVIPAVALFGFAGRVRAD